jgi:hypothetical protein
LQQLIGGPSRRMGILLATGLLLGGPLAGWAVLAGIVLRILWERLAGLVRLPAHSRSDTSRSESGQVNGAAALP